MDLKNKNKEWKTLLLSTTHFFYFFKNLIPEQDIKRTEKTLVLEKKNSCAAFSPFENMRISYLY